MTLGDAERAEVEALLEEVDADDDVQNVYAGLADSCRAFPVSTSGLDISSGETRADIRSRADNLSLPPFH